MKKIVFIITSFRAGGAEKFIVNLANNLDSKKYMKSIIVINGEGPFRSQINKDIELVDLKISRVSKSRKALIESINHINPDIIFSTLTHLNLTILSLKKAFKSNPKIIVREATNLILFLGKGNMLKKVFYKTAIRLFYKNADKIIMQCLTMKDDFIRNFKVDLNKVITIYNPVDIKKIESLSNESVLDYDFLDEELNLISVGRLSQEKDFKSLIDAIPLLIKKYHLRNVKLLIIGEGPERDNLMSQIESLGLEDVVHLIGFKDNPYKYMKRADIFVLSSKIEGFPNVLLEALGCKLKIVSTDCISGPKEILGNNEFGYLCEVENPISLADAIFKSATQSKSINNRVEDFSIENIMKKFSDEL